MRLNFYTQLIFFFSLLLSFLHPTVGFSQNSVSGSDSQNLLDSSRQDSSKMPQSYPFHRHQIGVSASSFSGYGLSYRIAFSEKILIRFTGFGFVNSSNVSTINERTESTLVLGTELQYTLKSFESVRFYLLGGVNRFYEQTTNSASVRSNNVMNSMEDWRFGFGFGTEFKIFNSFFLNIDIGGIYENSSTFSEFRIPPEARSTFIGFGLGLGLSYGL
ncbi:MAG: hypothetical protein SFU91_00370 [Chloroherpetonaceae bacterium]|nr:hypothetical protein [Chloroherpetonaceae bacterium]